MGSAWSEYCTGSQMYFSLDVI